MSAAYEGFEDPESFPSHMALERYRAELIARTEPQADFLSLRLREAAHVLEIACGNGRLLIELAHRGKIESAVGIDLAASRVDFARRWANETGVQGLRFEVADALKRDLPEAAFDAAVCITGAFGYFEAYAPKTAAQLARRMGRALRPGGLVCLEIYSHAEHVRLLTATGGTARLWTELPAEDPWRFYLSELSLDFETNVLTHEKTFIHRTSGEIDAGRREQLFLYTSEALEHLLAEAGFAEIRAYDGWNARPYEGGEVMVVTAVKPSPT